MRPLNEPLKERGREVRVDFWNSTDWRLEMRRKNGKRMTKQRRKRVINRLSQKSMQFQRLVKWTALVGLLSVTVQWTTSWLSRWKGENWLTVVVLPDTPLSNVQNVLLFWTSLLNLPPPPPPPLAWDCEISSSLLGLEAGCFELLPTFANWIQTFPFFSRDAYGLLPASYIVSPILPSSLWLVGLIRMLII